MTDHAAKRPFPLTPEPSRPWLGVKAPDKMRDGSSPNSTVFGEPLSGAEEGFADGGLIANGVTPLPSPGSALQPQLLADGGKVEENGDEKREVDPEDLGSGLLSDAATDLTGRELQVENQIRAAQGLPPLKKNSFAEGGRVDRTAVGTRAKAPNTTIRNADGSESSEQNISVGFDKGTELIPTIIKGDDGVLQKHSDEDAIRLFKEGKTQSRGRFKNAEEADEFSKRRSKAGGRFQITKATSAHKRGENQK